MTASIADLEAEVLSLPAEERARLLERLIESFEPQTAAQRAWHELALQRRADVATGKTSMIPGNDALARIRSRLA